MIPLPGVQAVADHGALHALLGQRRLEEHLQAALYAKAVKDGNLKGDVAEYAKTVDQQEQEHVDLLTKLLNRDPAQRLGANGSAEIKAHVFFHAIDWRKLLQRKYEPTFKPSVVS